MKWRDIKEDGRIVKGVNTTVDVGTDEIKKQAAKFGFKVDKDGRPQNHPTKIKGKSTNVLFNLGLAESVAIKFERTDEYDILHIKEKGKNRVEVRGKKGYESGNYDPKDKLHRVLDKLGKAANISELMNGETVVLNPKHPNGPRAIKTVTSECPRTKASSCQCESVNKVTEAQETVTAVCELYPNDNVEGTILFKQQPNKPTLIIGEIKGLSPGKHGFHIHEFGDLSKGCESAGGHYNPDGIDHGDLSKGHVGDLGNITADENGIAEIRIVAERVDLLGERSVVGRSVVVHSDVDDLGKGGNEESLKTGNAGDRLACGVIVMKETVNETTVYSRDELPQIKNKQLSKLKHTIETVALADIIPVQEERIVENFKRQVDNIVAGKYKPIVVDCNNKIVNGHHRYTALKMLGYESIEVARLPWSLETILEKWSQKYKRSINCNNPKGFSQKAHCQGRKKKESIEEGKLKSKSYKKAVKAAAMQGKRPKKKLKTKFSENFADGKVKGKVYNESTDLDSLRKFVRSQREAPDQVLYQMMMAPDTYGHSASNFVRSWYEKTKEENGLNDVDSALEIMVDQLGMNENFADGKRKGKSRPGRVKRSGASCNGSVTSLRKKAAKYSGEKGKMYHWCANMKSGRKK